jgi:2'-5' RNA ligase
VRLFIAVDPPEEVVDHLGKALGPVRAAWPGMRWGDSKQWHLTLTFCGEVSDRVAERLSQRLASAARRHAPMTLSFIGGGAFPRPSRGGVLWVGVAGGTAPLARLADSTSAAARRCGLPVEERRYRPHLTVARVAPAIDLCEPVLALSSYAGPAWTVDALHLTRSHLGGPGRGTVHERIGTWPLRTP